MNLVRRNGFVEFVLCYYVSELVLFQGGFNLEDREVYWGFDFLVVDE